MSTCFLYFKLNGINHKDLCKKALCNTSPKSVCWLNRSQECCNEKKLNFPLNLPNQVQYRQWGMRLNVTHTKVLLQKVRMSAAQNLCWRND